MFLDMLIFQELMFIFSKLRYNLPKSLNNSKNVYLTLTSRNYSVLETLDNQSIWTWKY